MIIFRALLLAALPLLSAVAEVFDTETTNSPSSSKSAKSSNGDDDIDFDEVVQLAGGVQGVLALAVFANRPETEEEDDTSSTRMLVEVPNPLDCDFAKYTCKNDQNTTVIAAVSTTEFAGLLNETTACYIPPSTKFGREVPGSMKVCNTIATSFDASRNLDGCVTVLEILKRTLQLKKAANQRTN